MRRSALLLSITVLQSFVGFVVVGCGGSGSRGGNGGGQTGSNPPQVVGIAPATAQVGAQAITIIAYGSAFADGATIQWNGTALASNCVGSNILIPVDCSTATAIIATIPASDFATAGSANVTVANPTGSSSAFAFTIAPAPAGNTWVQTVAGITAPNDIAADTSRGKLYVSVSSTDTSSPNSIVTIDPITNTASAPVAAGNNPDLLSISSDDAYLWVGLDGSNIVQRFNLPALTKDIAFPLPATVGGNPQQAVALEAAPSTPHTVGLVAGNWGYSPAGNGVYVFDDAIQRPTYVPGFGAEDGPMIDWMQWGSDSSVMYGNQYTTEDAGGIATMKVTPAGVTLSSYNGVDLSPIITQYDPANDVLYSYGDAFDPTKPTQVGQFGLPESGAEACTADSTLNRYYCVTTFSEGGTDLTAFELLAFDLKTYALMSQVYFGYTSEEASYSAITGRPLYLVRWGNAGLALATYTAAYYGNGGVFLIDGAAVNPNSAPDTSTGTASDSYAQLSSLSPQSTTATSGDVAVAINGSGFSPDSTACWDCSFIQLQLLPTTYVSPTQLDVTVPIGALPTEVPLEISVFDQSANLFSSNALTFTIAPLSTGSTQVTPLNLCGLGMAWDVNSGLLYVGVADYDGAYPNSIVAIDGSSGTVAKSVAVEPDPMFLSDGANGQFLYVAYGGSTNLTQLALPGLNTTASAPLNNPQDGPWLAGDMKAAPQDPHTAAVTLIDPTFQPEALGGVVVFDDGVPRPNFAPGWGDGQAVPAFFDTVAWSASDQLLTSAPAGWDYGNTGPLSLLQVNASGVAHQSQGVSAFNINAGDIHSDFGTDLIYSDDGTVANPNTGAIAGNYGASGLVAPDSSLNRVFILGQTAAQANSSNFTIESFDQKGFTLVSSITLSNLSGSPIQLVRWGASGLALLTIGGFADVYANALGMLYLINDPNFVSSSAPAAQVANQELVKQRWRRLPKREMLKLAQQAARSRCCAPNNVP